MKTQNQTKEKIELVGEMLLFNAKDIVKAREEAIQTQKAKQKEFLKELKEELVNTVFEENPLSETEGLINKLATKHFGDDL